MRLSLTKIALLLLSSLLSGTFISLKTLQHWKPIFIEDSHVPIWLSRIAPIEIEAITLFFLVFSRGKLDNQTKNHESIHFQQYLETLVVGFVFFYLWDYIRNQIVFRNRVKAYRMIRAEREAYRHESNLDYLAQRKRWRWLWGSSSTDLYKTYT